MPLNFQKFAFIATALVSILVLPASAQEAGTNLLVNGDFQTEGKNPGQPDKWDAAKAPVSWEVEDGNRFLRLTAPEPDKFIKYYRRVDLPAGVKAIEFSWKQRVVGLKRGKRPEHDARMIVNFKDGASQPIKGPWPAYTQKDTPGWIDKKMTFLVPDGAVVLEFMPVLFNTAAGTFDLDDMTMKPIDPAPLLALKSKKEAQEKFGNVAPEAPNKAKWPTTLKVVGNKVVNAEDKEVLLRGVNMPSLGWKHTGEYPLRSIMVAVDGWKSNVIRLPVKEEFWFGTNPDQKDGGVAYRKLVDDAITIAANRGAYTVLDLHRFRAPKQVHIDFWKDAAAKYKDHPAVIFDLFNEPYSISWKVWRDGGFVEDKNAGPDEVAFLTPEEKALNVNGFKSVGMQALINAVREVGANNIVIVGGLDYSYDLSGLSEGYMVDEKSGNGVMLSTHIYAQKRDWPKKVMQLADKYPIFVGEFGANTKKFDFMPAAAQEDATIFIPRIFGFMQKYNIHYTGWSFHPQAGPTMLLDWDFTPTPEWGAVAKRALGGEQFPYVGMR